MQLVIFGAGALGTLFGVKAAMGGAKVSLIGREAHVKAVNENGVRLTGTVGKNFVYKGENLKAFTSINEVEGKIDYLMVTAKDRGMDAVLVDLEKNRDRILSVFSFQNGITHDDKIANVVGWDKVIGSVTIEGADMPEPGVIEYNLTSYSYFGEFSGTSSERVEKLADCFRKGGMDIRVVPNIKSVKWTKFVQICGASGICGATRLGFAPAARTLAGAQIYVGILKEGIAIMRALGLEPGDYFPNISMVNLVANHPLPEALERVCKVSDELYKKGFLGGTSLARDIERGKKSEVDSLMGTLYAIGDKMGIPTPVTKAVYWVIKSVDEYAK